MGGHFENRFGSDKKCNKLYSYVEGKWVEKYPSMPTRRCRCTAVYTENALIVVGGSQDRTEVNYSTVEILNTVS